jgi:dipeptidyl aminopeptidase/acylaminoacyl peptidase
MKKLRPNLKLGLGSAIALFIALFSSSVLAALPPAAQTILEGLRPEFSSTQVSPSGKYISTILRRDNRNTLVILDRKTGAPSPGKSVRYDKKDFMEVSGGQWLSGDIFAYQVMVEDLKDRPYGSSDVFLLYMDKDVNERVWTASGNYVQGRSGDRIAGSMNIISTLQYDKERVLVSVSPWKRRDGGVRPVIYTMKLSTGNFRKVAVGPGRGAQISSNRTGTMLFASVPQPELTANYFYYDRTQEEPEWQPISLEFPGQFSLQYVTNDGKYAYGLTQLEEGINAPRHLIKVSMETQDFESVRNFGFVSDIDLSFDKKGDLIYAQWIDDGPKSISFKTTTASKVIAGFEKGFPGFNISLTGMDDESENLTLHVSSTGLYGEHYVWEKDTGQARYLFSSQESVDQLNLNQLQSVKYKTSDGVMLQGWLLMPRSGKPKALINHIHGGPHGPFIEYRFNAGMQILSEMGYAVFAPNFRGSGGYGQNLERAGYKKWGTRMLDDMREGAEYVQKNYDVGDKVYTYGGSYGGYSSAQNVVRHNDYYDCSVIIAGFFEFDELMDTWDGRRGYWTNDYTSTAMGTDPVALRSMSPIHNLDKVKVPLLVIHGKADARTPLAGAKKYVKALEKTDVDFKHHFYSDEGHGMYFDENREDEFQKVQRFLNQCDARAPLNPSLASR